MGYFSRAYGTGTDTIVGTLANGGEKWIDEVNTVLEDSTYGYCKVSGTYSEYLDYRGMSGYGTVWPSNTVITGAELWALGYSEGGPNNHECYSVYLAINGVQEGSDIGPTGLYLPELDQLAWTPIAGGNGEMWGLSSDQIKAYTNEKKMGHLIDFSDRGGAGGSIFIDDMRLVIYYDVFKTHSLLGCGL